MSQYSKNLSGVSQKVLVGTATYTAATTYEAFISSAYADGEIGVFLDTGAVRTTALSATVNKFFIAQKRDGFVNKTPILDYNDIFRKVQTDYVAPVKQVSYIGYIGSGSADLGFNFTTASSTNTLTYGITARETTPGNQPFPVQEGYATVNSTTANEYTVLAAIVSQLNGDFDYQRTAPDRFVKAEILQSSTTTAITVAATLAVTNGSTTITFNAAPTGAPVAGEYIAIGGTGQTGAVYKITSITDTTNYVLDRPYTGDTNLTLAIANVLKAPFVSGTSLLGVKLTAINFETHFKVVGAALNYLDTVTVGTAWKLGSGSGQQIYDLETTEGAIFDGVGSTINAAFKADYGQPEAIASTSGTYHQIFLDFAVRNVPSAVPTQSEQKQIQRILIAAPSSGTLESTLGTVFGV
jgi:hypothetical protein